MLLKILYIYMKFISLGTNCFSAAILKIYGLRDCSYMFDWSETTIDSILDILNNYSIDYNNALIDKSTLINFIHHTDLSYRKRAIERFFSILKSNEEKVFLLSTKENIEKEKINEIVNILKKKTSNFKIIYIYIIPSINNKLYNIENYLNLVDYWCLETPYSTPYPSGISEGILKYKIFYEILKEYLDKSIDEIFTTENIETEISIYPIISQEQWNNL
jgi:hypothetical protein